MEINQISASRKTRVTTGHNFNFDSVELFFSASATVEDGEDRVEAEEQLQTFVDAAVNRQVNKYVQSATSNAAAVSEKVAEVHEEQVPRVQVPQKSQANWTETPAQATAPSAGAMTTGQLEVGKFPKGATLTAKVTKVWPPGDRGPSGGKSILDGGVEVAHWDGAPEWSEGDTIEIKNAFQVKEYNGKYQLDLGKFSDVSITASAPPATVTDWA